MLNINILISYKVACKLTLGHLTPVYVTLCSTQIPQISHHSLEYFLALPHMAQSQAPNLPENGHTINKHAGNHQ